MIIPQLEGRTLTKAHGTGNDFILVPDFAGTLDLPAEAVASVCDRHFGIGADGLIRVVRTASVPEAADVARDFPEAEWFMDYRNADGSIAQMCGNGLRVFVHYLRVQGVIDLKAGRSVDVATRGGVKTVSFDGAVYTIDMGEYGLPRGDAGDDTQVTVPGVGKRPALSVTMPNPHTVVLLDSAKELEAARLAEAPQYEPVPPEGTNLELVVADPGDQLSLGDRVSLGGQIGLADQTSPGGQDNRADQGLTGQQMSPSNPALMRVLERGVGETLACGTGTCAAALAVLLSRGKREGEVQLRSPGGPLTVRIEGGRAFLTGPAVLVAEFSLIGVAGYSGE